MTTHWTACVDQDEDTIHIKMFNTYETAQKWMEVAAERFDAVIYTRQESVIINLCKTYNINPTPYLTA